MSELTRENLHAVIDRWVTICGEKSVVEAIVASLDSISSSIPGKPPATIASINSNLLRQALGRMV